MRLIERYDIDPNRVGFLGLGTESSTDNSAGAVIVKGMLDEGLQARGRAAPCPSLRGARGQARLPRRRLCPEARAALSRARKRRPCAIVVSADIAEYARGSSGEPTQGAGAVAMLLERNAEDAHGTPRAHRHRVVVPGRRLPQTGAAQHHPRQASTATSKTCRCSTASTRPRVISTRLCTR